MWQNIVVIFILVLAIFWFVFKFLKKPSCACNNSESCIKMQADKSKPLCCQKTSTDLSNDFIEEKIKEK